MGFLESESEWYVFAIIPFVSGLVGWGTNWLALKMTFYPLEFWPWRVWQPEDEPFGLFGWQGIIPAKAATMAGDLTDTLTTKIFSVEEIFTRIDPEGMADCVEPGLQPSTRRIISQLAEEFSPTVWASLPTEVHDEIFEAVREHTRGFVVALMAEMQSNILKVFDLKHMVIGITVQNKDYLVDMFQTIGDEEFVFIERSGFYFGFLFGLVQMVIFYFYDAWWILPLAGFFVGYATNWLALFVIFNPLEPHATPCGTMQGLFLKRQPMVAQKFAEMSEELFLQPENMWNEMFTGANHEAFDKMLEEHAMHYCDKTLGKGKLLAGLVFGERYYTAKARFAELMREELPSCTHLSNAYMRKCLDLKDEIESKMAVLDPVDFERVLHAVFEADEIKLILVGAVLGTAAGFAQTFAFGGGIP